MVSYSYILLAILDLGICLRLGHGRGICIVDAFIIPRPRVAYVRDMVVDMLVCVCVRALALNS